MGSSRITGLVLAKPGSLIYGVRRQTLWSFPFGWPRLEWPAQATLLEPRSLLELIRDALRGAHGWDAWPP